MFLGLVSGGYMSGGEGGLSCHCVAQMRLESTILSSRVYGESGHPWW